MSKFITSIPVDLSALRAAIPAGSWIGKAKLDESGSQITLEWEHDRYNHALSIAVPFHMETLMAFGVPDGVTDRRPTPPIVEAAPEPEAEEAPKRGPGRPKKL